jgi:hypothetical protein
LEEAQDGTTALLRVALAEVCGSSGTGGEAHGTDQMILIASLGSAVLGALLGALLAFFLDRRRTQIDTAFHFHREYSDGLVEEREAAVRFIRDHEDGRNLAELWRTEDVDQMRCVWKLVYFYERLNVALQHHQVSRRLAPDLFGDAFNFWYTECFESKLVGIDDPTARHVRELRTLLCDISTEQQRGSWEHYRTIWRLEPDPTAPTAP